MALARNTFVTLKKRSEFLRVRGGGRATASGFVLEGKPRNSDRPDVSGPRFGFTISKKVGKAVTRNRIRRRLRAALALVSPDVVDPATDYVVIARAAAAAQEFRCLVSDLARALDRVRHAGSKPTRRA